MSLLLFTPYVKVNIFNADNQKRLAILFNFGVDWDEAENMILLTPELPYTE